MVWVGNLQNVRNSNGSLRLRRFDPDTMRSETIKTIPGGAILDSTGFDTFEVKIVDDQSNPRYGSGFIDIATTCDHLLQEKITNVLGHIITYECCLFQEGSEPDESCKVVEA
eukprot:TRINITY_DN5417_c1_g1_i2.p2 TRINITY_DN5417_c1_g1~~TRINITY_DN5417_c1_g1_i2.p2  ORF type:complete len:112 (+),score=3.36 TRINITY_DN5417_c1_g1_i2:253-588(+)